MEKKVYQSVKNNGEYSCGDIGISTSEWFELLQDHKADAYIETLLCFLRESEHKSAPGSLALKYNKPPMHFIGNIIHFSKWVEKKLDRFTITGVDGKETYWLVAIQKGWKKKDEFVWQLRDELVEALQSFLMRKLIDLFSSGKPLNGYDEEYKWELLEETNGKDVIDIVKALKGNNLIYSINAGVLQKLCETRKNELTICLNHLFDESNPIDERLADFKSQMKAICPDDWNNCANDECTASALLTCKDPEKYTFYMNNVYQSVCNYFGFEKQKPGRKYSHFLNIINRFAAEFGDEIQQIIEPHVGEYNIKPTNLAVQTVFWCMKDEMEMMMKNISKSYWLAGISFGGTDSQLDRFVNEGVWECRYDDGKKSDKKLLDLTTSIEVGDVLILKSTSTKGANHDQPFIRVKAVGLVTSDISTSKVGKTTICSCQVKYVSVCDKDFDGIKFGSYRSTIHKIDDQLFEIIDYADAVLASGAMNQNKYQEYIDLLKSCHNLVLTGAPGTGKTHMAREIAAEMGAETMFVQFHPSYDYTDFVEGLRPVMNDDGQIGFERKDGVFKEFCSRAIRNLEDTQESINVKPFVCIIDEINRGEASKIFGELFYAIDPGYRGKKDILVQTQYQNLVPESDVFSKGFYVPENVYILATMNDIDRSVESMDFAMRRRFTWKEVTPTDTESMLDNLSCADEAKKKMHQLNDVINETEGLGSAFAIGPAYFLKLRSNGGDFSKLWTMNIKPLLKEYLRGFRNANEKLDEFRKAYFSEEEVSESDVH